MENNKKRRVYDPDVKKKIVSYAEENGNRAAGRLFNIPESCIRLWRKQQPEILSSTSSTQPTEHKTIAGLNNEIDEALYEYIKDLRNNNKPISVAMIQLKLQDIAMSLNVPQTEFEPTRSWIKAFIKRKMFPIYCKITTSCKVTGEYEKKLLKYQHFIIQLRKQNKYLLNQIGHVNEVSVFLSSSTQNEKGIRVMLCGTADGGKLPPYIIFKSEAVLKKKFPNDVIVRTQHDGCLTHELLLDWYRTVWCCRPGLELNPRALLALDSSVSHLLTEDWLLEGNTDLVVVPNGRVSLPQPVNIYINKAFKERLRLQCEKWLLSQGRLKSASPSLLSHWISAAWYEVPRETVFKSFKKCYLSTTLEDTAEDNEACPSEDEYIVSCDEDEISGASESPNSGKDDDVASPKEEFNSEISQSSSREVQSSTSTEQNEEPIPLELVATEIEVDDPLDIGTSNEDSSESDTLNIGGIKEEMNNIKMEQQGEAIVQSKRIRVEEKGKQQDVAPDGQTVCTEDSEIVVVVYDEKLMFLHGTIQIPSTSTK